MPAPLGKHVYRPKASRPKSLTPIKQKKIQTCDPPELMAKCLTCPVPVEHCKGSPDCVYRR